MNHLPSINYKIEHPKDRNVATSAGSTPPRKGKDKVVDVTNSDEKSSSLLGIGIDRPCTAAAIN
jgi:hypothetical protein